jgi:putative ABC transport system permease protein
LWQRRFGGRDDAIGKTLSMNGRAMQVIGVMPEGFAFPNRETQFWVPTGASEQQRASRNSLWLQVIGRMKPGVSVDQAQADLARVSANLLQQFPGRKGYGVYVNGYTDHVVGRIRPAILVLLGAVACVLLIACTNVANLLLARASVRERELALRAAIGAGRGRLVRQLLTESLLIGLTGGIIGVALAKLGVSALIAIAPRDLPRLDAISMDWRVLGFTVLLSLATSVVFGLIPALQLARTDAGQTMKEGARGSSALSRPLRRGLVVVELALAVVLLIGAGLMLRSFDQMRRVDLGFAPERLLTGRVVLWGEKYREAASRVEFFQQVIARTKADPAVEGVAGIGTVF